MGLRASWFHARVRVVFNKRAAHRMIEVPSVSHAAWTYWRTGKSFKMLKGGRVGMSVSHIFKPYVNGSVPWIKMRWWPRFSSCRHVGKNIKYTMTLFSRGTGCLGEKKNATCTIFSAFCTKPNGPLSCKRPRQSLYINLFYSLSPKWSSHFPQLPLFGAGILEKTARVTYTAHYWELLSVCQRA